MALEDFYPWKPGQTIRSQDLNELVALIQNGTIFQNTTYITEQISTNASRLNGLEARVSELEALQGLLNIREQFVMTNGQSIVNLSQAPSLDTEVIFLNGLSLAKNDVPIGLSGDYSLSGSTLTFVSELASQIVAGDRLIVVYRYVA